MSPAADARRRPALALAFAIALAACAGPPAPRPAGALILRAAAARTLQYRRDQIRSASVTIAPVTAGESFTRRFDPPAWTGSALAFRVENLLPGTYTARVDVFMGSADTLPGGSAISPAFSVEAAATTEVVLPALALAPTPIGDWHVATQVTTGPGAATGPRPGPAWPSRKSRPAPR